MHSILYWVDKNNILGPAPADPESDPQFDHWEIPVQNWWAQNKNKYPVVTLADKPTQTDDIHIEQNKPAVSIIEPDNATIYPPDKKINLKISSSSVYPLLKMDIFINGVYLQTVEPPFDFSFTPSDLGNLQSSNDLKVIVYDTVYNNTETDSSFSVAQ